MNKKLVAYFSASGVTAKLAKNLAEAIDADLFEIKPVNLYSEADQNWKNPLARCNKEKLGKKDVPVSGVVENMAEYDTVYLGFPIWYWSCCLQLPAAVIWERLRRNCVRIWEAKQKSSMPKS